MQMNIYKLYSINENYIFYKFLKKIIVITIKICEYILNDCKVVVKLVYKKLR